MNMIRASLAPLLFASLASAPARRLQSGIAARRAPPPAAQSTATTAQPQTALGRMVDNGVREARNELKKQHRHRWPCLDPGRRDHHAAIGTRTCPRAQITPQGDLLIEGKAVAVTPEQRALLLTYRQQIIDVAEAGMYIGVQGADLAGKAVSECWEACFSGKGEDFGKHMEAEGRAGGAGRQLCMQLPSRCAPRSSNWRRRCPSSSLTRR